MFRKMVFPLTGLQHRMNYFQQYADVHVRAPILVVQIKHLRLVLPVCLSCFELTVTVSSSSVSKLKQRKKKPRSEDSCGGVCPLGDNYTRHLVLNDVIDLSLTHS